MHTFHVATVSIRITAAAQEATNQRRVNGYKPQGPSCSDYLKHNVSHKHCTYDCLYSAWKDHVRGDEGRNLEALGDDATLLVFAPR